MGRLLQTSHRLSVLRGVIAAWVLPSLAIAASAPRATVRVEIDVSAIEAFDAGGIERDLRARTEHILDERGYFLDDAAADSVVVRIDYVDKEDLEYGIHIYVYDDGRVVQPGEEWLVCKYCPHSMVAERFAERLPGALVRLEAANAAAKDEPAKDEPVKDEPAVKDEPVVKDGTALEDGPEREREAAAANGSAGRPAGTLVLRNVGLGVLVPGVAALGVGMGLVLAGTRRVDRGDDVMIFERHYRPPGIAMTVVGGAATAAGIGLLVAHALRGRGKAHASERVRLGPLLGGQAGVVLRGRF
jgi:hypothetical protein